MKVQGTRGPWPLPIPSVSSDVLKTETSRRLNAVLVYYNRNKCVEIRKTCKEKYWVFPPSQKLFLDFYHIFQDKIMEINLINIRWKNADSQIPR